MTQIYKFDTTVDPIKMYEVDNGQLEQDTLKKNQTLSYDPLAQTVTLTTTFSSYIKSKVFALTPDLTDDASFYQRQSVTFTSLDGHVINDPTANESDGDVLGDQDHDGSNDDSIHGDGGKNVLNGGAGDDHLSGLASADILHGGTGNDDLLGGSGNDVLDGGAGNDALVGDTGADILDAGSGDDILDGGDGYDKLFGGDGNDDLLGGGSGDLLDGGTGNDHLFGNEGDDKLLGGDGNDALSGGIGKDGLNGGAGDDTLEGNDDNDNLKGEAGADTLLGGLGDDKLDGGDGNDVLRGGEGSDQLGGGKGDDNLLGGEGNDKLQGGEGNDVFLAGQDTGNDAFSGGKGADVVDYSAAQAGVSVDLFIGVASAVSADSGTGVDKLSDIETAIGSAFADVIVGSKGANTISGGDGDDRITGNKGADLLTGGAGNDTFAYIDVQDSAFNKTDTITDFTAGDKIDLSGIDAVSKRGNTNDTFTWSDTAPASGHGAGVVWFDAASHTLYASVNNNSAPELAIVLTGVDTLTAADLVL